VEDSRNHPNDEKEKQAVDEGKFHVVSLDEK